MNKSVEAQNVPQAIGPYSHAVITGNMIYTSGQMGVDKKGDFVGGVAEQTNQCLINIKAILDTAGFEMKDIVKTLVFLSDMNNFAVMNEQYSKHFEGTYPARSCVEVARLPKDALVEIEVIAAK